MTEETNWVEWFENRIQGDLHGYVRRQWVYNEFLWRVIQKRFPKGATILECGSGSGTYSMALGLMGYKVVGLDFDPNMVELANRICKEIGADDNVTFKVGSILELDEHYGQYDLAYSSGVLEHFEDEEVVAILNEEARCAKEVIAVVPSIYSWRNSKDDYVGKFYPYRIGRLRKRFKESNLKINEEFGYSSGSKMGRAVELFAPPVTHRFLKKHVSATIGIAANSTSFRPS